METEYYVDLDGNYLGGFSEGNTAIPMNAIQISGPPFHGWQKYNLASGQWMPLTVEQLIIIKRLSGE